MNPRLTLGVAHLLKQGAFRALGSYMLLPETNKSPSLHISAGVQGIGTGNPGYALTTEKNWQLRAGSFNAFVGVGYRSNSKITRLVGGFKYSPDGVWGIGLQDDGLKADPFITYSPGRYIVGFYLIDKKDPAYLVGLRF